jgi:hypothetical protein
VTTRPHGVGNALQSARSAVHVRVLIKKIQVQPVPLLYRLCSVLLQHCLRVSAYPTTLLVNASFAQTGRDRSCPESGKSGVSCIIKLPLFLVSFVGRKISLFSFLICRQSALVNKREVMAFFSKRGDSGMNSNNSRHRHVARSHSEV